MAKTVLVTGASSGIGEATAKYFIQKGWNVAAKMRSPHKVGDWSNPNMVEPGGIKTNFITRQEWANHPAYEPEVNNMIEMTTNLNNNLPGSEGVAKVIYRAAIDRTERLRYTAQPGPYLLMHKVMPDSIWRSIVGMALNTHAGK